MRNLVFGFLLTILTLCASSVHAQQWVNGYTKRDGTYVAPYQRSAPDGNPYNNLNGR